MSTSVIVLIAIAAVALLGAVSAIRIVREYERVVVFRLGRLRGARGPGLALLRDGCSGAGYPAATARRTARNLGTRSVACPRTSLSGT